MVVVDSSTASKDQLLTAPILTVPAVHYAEILRFVDTPPDHLRITEKASWLKTAV
jgi:hypothetical protein